MRFIIYSTSWGTYIGATYGGPFFSGYSGSTFKNTADTFTSATEALDYAEQALTGDDFPADLRTLAVQTDVEQATMDECVAAGAADWKHHIARLASDPECYGRPFSGAGQCHGMVFGPARGGKAVWPGIQAPCDVPNLSAQRSFARSGDNGTS